MTKIKLGVTAAAGALIFGMSGYAAAASEQHDLTAKNIMVAADDSATEDDSAAGDADNDNSGKMGDDQDQGSAPAEDTQKMGQPSGDPAAGDAPDEESDDVMPPDEDEGSDQPE